MRTETKKVNTMGEALKKKIVKPKDAVLSGFGKTVKQKQKKTKK